MIALSHRIRKQGLAWLLAVCMLVQLVPQIAALPDTQAEPQQEQSQTELQPPQTEDPPQDPAASNPESDPETDDPVNQPESPPQIPQEPGGEPQGPLQTPENGQKPEGDTGATQQDEGPSDGEQPDEEPSDDEPDPVVTGMDAFVIPEEEVTCPFTDVTESAWYYKYVAYITSLGMISGRTPTTFAPDQTITVAEGIALVVRVYQKYYGITEKLVRPEGSTWYEPYIEAAKDYGILPEGLTNYTSNLTRQQAAALFYYVLPQEELEAINDIHELADVGKNNPYYDEILALYNAGILSGTEATYGSFRPANTIKRSEFVRLMYALILPEVRVEHSFQSYTGMEAFDASRYDIICTFEDVQKSDWYYRSVSVMQTLGLLSGMTQTQYSPNTTVTLAQALSVAVRVYQKYHGITDGVPAAAPGETWYDRYVKLAREYGILKENWTNYNSGLSRNRLAILFCRVLPEKELAAINKVTSLPDMTSADEGYAQVLTLYNAGILSGNDAYGTFRPYSTVKRSELASLLTRLVDPDYRQKFELQTHVVGEKIVYGTSGAGRELCAYRYGTGKNVMIVGFAIHGYEDNYAKDGAELVYTAESLQTILKNNMHVVEDGNWSVYVLPCMNPDGLYGGWTNYGPGRCTTTYLTSSGMLSSAHGVDMNRSFPANFVVQTDARNYTGPAPLSCKESQALAAFVRQVKGTGKNVCIDTHGWTQQIIPSTGTGGRLYQVFHSAFPGNSYANCTYAKGYFTAYTTSLGYDSCLFEFPGGIRSHNEFLSSGYSAKYITCIMNLLNRY